jgi:predicted DNA-binding transcriptional regulator AlpA
MPDDIYLLPTEAALYLRVAPKTLTKWRGQGKGPPYRKVAGSLIRYVQSELEAWMQAQAVRPSGDDAPPPPTPRSSVHALPPRRRASRTKY